MLAAVSASIVTVGPASNHHSVGVRRGTTIQVRLPASPSTGYAWSVVSKRTPVLSRGRPRYVPARKSVFAGTAGTFIQTFTARRRGRTVLRLAYARRTGPPAKRYTLTVIVR